MAKNYELTRDPIKRAASLKAYKERNKERLKERDRKFYRDTLEYQKIRSRIYYLRNKQKRDEYLKHYHESYYAENEYQELSEQYLLLRQLEKHLKGKKNVR